MEQIHTYALRPPWILFLLFHTASLPIYRIQNLVAPTLLN